MAAEGLYFNKYCPIILLIVVTVFSNCCVFGQISLEENGSNAQALHSLGYTGLGVNVGLIACRNVRSTHQAFNDSNGIHVFNYDYSGSDVNYAGGSVSGHDTWVAGLIASRGWTGHANDIGASPGCNIYSARVVTDAGATSQSYIEKAFDALINSYNCRVFVLPLQFSDTANGSSVLTKMVDYYAYTNNIVLALAAGNKDTDVTRISIFGDAYNGITTGALIDEPNDNYSKVGNLSLPGLTVDSRKKPDICAPGSRQVTPSIGSDTSYYTTLKDGATSFSIPQTGGIAALLLQYADSSDEADDDKNVVIKAVIVNSTFPNIRNKSGAYTDPANNVWDPNRGYGRIDALKAYQILSAGKISTETTVTAIKGWAYNSMSSGQTHTYMISGNRNERLVSTITWNRKINKEGPNYNEDSPKFNIDLIIKDPYDVNVYSESDTANNLIKVDLPLETTGEYKVILKNTTTATRPYGLAFELREPLAGDFNSDFIVNRKDLSLFAGDWLKSEAGLDTDIIPDANVNNLDFGEFAENWMRIDCRYYNP